MQHWLRSFLYKNSLVQGSDAASAEHGDYAANALQGLGNRTVDRRIASYPDFWRFYLREHANPLTRAWHYLGTTLTLLCLIAAVALRQPWFFLASVVLGYASAWIGHFTAERNHPATFRYPLWSLFSDFRMFGAWLSGRLAGELAAAGIGETRKQKAGS